MIDPAKLRAPLIEAEETVESLAEPLGLLSDTEWGVLSPHVLHLRRLYAERNLLREGLEDDQENAEQIDEAISRVKESVAELQAQRVRIRDVIYVVQGECGAYSDYRLWMVCWFPDHDSAERYAKKLNGLSRKIRYVPDVADVRALKELDRVVDNFDIRRLELAYRVAELHRGEL